MGQSFNDWYSGVGASPGSVPGKDVLGAAGSLAGSAANFTQLFSQRPEVKQGTGAGSNMPPQQTALTNYPTAPLSSGGSYGAGPTPLPLEKAPQLQQLLQLLMGGK